MIKSLFILINQTPLHIAIENCDVKTVKHLIKKGADPKIKSEICL